MPVPKFVRESAFELARHDLALFLEEHEQDLLTIFREEMQHLDDELPEEDVYIDIDLIGIGDILIRAVLKALRRFLTETSTSPTRRTPIRRARQRTTLNAAERINIKIPVNPGRTSSHTKK